MQKCTETTAAQLPGHRSAVSAFPVLLSSRTKVARTIAGFTQSVTVQAKIAMICGDVRGWATSITHRASAHVSRSSK